MSRFKDSWGKAKILLSQLLCIGAVFTACTDDEVFNQTTKALQVSVSTETPAESRAIIDGGYLPDGASIGVTLTAEDGTAYDGQAFTNLQYTAAGEGSAQTWSSATPASLSITAGKVIAYYPYYGGDDFDLKAVPVETASQTDYMYAKPVTGINMVSPSANLTMQHAMTDIRINVKKGTYTGTGEVTKITAKAPAFATSATMDVETGMFANVSGGGAQFVQELTGAAISSGNVVHDFLIVPDAKSTSGEVSIFVIIDGKKFAVTVPYTECFQQGFAYTYNLTLDNAALTLDGVSVAKWGVKAEVDESLKFYDDQYVVEIQVPSDNYEFVHNIDGFVGTIDWGDGTTTEYITSTSAPSHIYTSLGIYTVKAEGRMSALSSTNITIDGVTKVRSKIITKLIKVGKDMKLSNISYAFINQTQLVSVSNRAFKDCITIKYKAESTFKGCTALEEIGDEIFANCINITGISYIFQSCSNLQKIGESIFKNCISIAQADQSFAYCSKLENIPGNIFQGCKNLSNLSLTFYSCSLLKNIDCDLFKDVVSKSNFERTFDGCSSLTTIPEGLFDNCTEVTGFSQTFANCSSLQVIPEGLFDSCTEVTTFWETFINCKTLQTIPEGLFKNNNKVTNFYGTFSDCSKLQVIPGGLFKYNTKVTSFSSTFADCSALTAIPVELFDKCTEVTNFYYTFFGTGLESITEGLFDNCPEVTSFRAIFGNTKIKNIPENLFKYNTKVTTFGGAFSSCESLTEIPENLFKYNINVESFETTFFGCSKIVSLPNNIFKECVKVKSFVDTFDKCTGLTSIPSGLFDNCTEVTNFGGTFQQCINLKSIPTGLFDYNTKVTSFSWVFGGYGDTKMNFTSIPVGLFDNCPEVTSFRGAFYGCSSLKSIPTGLFDHCTKVTDFSDTFYRCIQVENESPYTIVSINGEDTKVHLYERSNYPEYFTAPTSYSSCFYNLSKLIDYSSIPTDWKSY